MQIIRAQLKEYTSLRIGGEVNMVVVRNEGELEDAVMSAEAFGLRTHILGEGTNTYFGNDLRNFLVIKNEIKGATFFEEGDICFLEIGGGEVWDDIVQMAVEKKLWRIENLSYIPGTVGAAPIQNIGAYGTELQDVLVSVRVYDMNRYCFLELTNEECQFGYRDSIFKHEQGRYIIVSIRIKLTTRSTPVLTYKPLDYLAGRESVSLEEIRNLVVATRKAKLPDWKVNPNAGSFFKNPIIDVAKAEGIRQTYPDIPLIPHGDAFKVPAAWLIEHVACMKGVQTGNIGSWPNQPLVLVNYGQGEASELELFANSIITIIYKKIEMKLEKEVNYIH